MIATLKEKATKHGNARYPITKYFLIYELFSTNLKEEFMVTTCWKLNSLSNITPYG